VLEPAVAAGVIPLAVHPAMTFTGTSLDLVRLADCCFGVSAPNAALPIAQALVVEMGAEPVVVAEEMRPLYHAALAHGANHLGTLVAQALDLLAGAGVPDGARLLGPLLSASLDTALRHGDAALTGPVSRGDAGTVAAHLQVLGDSGVADAPAAYRVLARTTADRALASAGCARTPQPHSSRSSPSPPAPRGRDVARPSRGRNGRSRSHVRRVAAGRPPGSVPR
jgi:predicted short-subunit dehydrogenase-like oxidoreductase (DUF2520 family)